MPLNETYNTLLEMMDYFYIEYNIYCILFMIIIVNCGIAIKVYLNVKIKNSNLYFDCISPVIISTLCILALCHAYFFQAILADVSPAVSEMWYGKVTTILLISCFLFMVQLYCTNYYVKCLKEF